MLTQEVETLFAVLHSPNASEAALNRALANFMTHVSETSDWDEALAAATRLAEVFDWPDQERAFYGAVMSGALVENGFPTEPFSEAIANRLPVWANDAARFNERIVKQTGSIPEDEDGAYEERLGMVAAELSVQMPEEFDAWNRLQTFYMPIVSVLSVDSGTREQLAPVRETLASLAEVNEGADWLSKLLGVRNHTPLLVIEPATKRGFVGFMSGVADNFQLHTLLLAAWSEVDGERRISPTALATAKGEGAPESDETVSSPWNLLNWQALGAHGALPDPTHAMPHWIWNEGTPLDISSFEGYTVILLGEPPYERQWNAGRSFVSLPAHIEVEHILTLGETATWLSRLAGAPK